MNPGHRLAPCTRLARPVAPGRRWRGFAAVLAVGALLGACGGGTSQFEPFVPEQYVAFGDDTSVIRVDGRRHTVNPLTTDGAVDCAGQPIWVQAVANQFAFAFQECNPNNATTFKAQMRAVAGAKVDDLAAQIDSQLAAGGFAAKSLVTVMLGANDVLELYASYPQRSEGDLIAELQARGVRLAAQVNRLVDLGARVIVATAPDIGLSPFALQQKAAFTDTDRSALISRMTAALNGRLRVNILNDGRFVGLVLADEAVQTIVKVPSAFAVVNATAAACSVATPDCTTQTLVTTAEGTAATSATWLWADDLHLAYGGQARLGTLAVSRAIGNPF
jgi:outer membrane lipase/esterase